MNVYPDKIWRLFRDPRRAGRLEQGKGVVTGQATTPAGHARLQLQLQLGSDSRIEDARFLALGCPYLIATGAWLCAHLTGRRADAAAALQSADITEQLELPAVKRYCAVMAVEAIAGALQAAEQFSDVKDEQDD